MQHLLIEGYCDGVAGEEIYPCENSFIWEYIVLSVHGLAFANVQMKSHYLAKKA